MSARCPSWRTAWQDVDKEEALRQPELYWAGQSFQGINPRTLLTWFAQVLYQGSLTTFGCVWLLRCDTCPPRI